MISNLGERVWSNTRQHFQSVISMPNHIALNNLAILSLHS